MDPFASRCDVPRGAPRIDFTIVAGSGRFAHASGCEEMTGYVEFPGELTLAPWPAHWTWKATIRYCVATARSSEQ